MTDQEFINKLGTKWPKDMNTIDSDDILRMLPKYIDTSRLEELYDSILENYEYKTFPSWAFIKKQIDSIIGSFGGTNDSVIDCCRHVADQKQQWKKWTAKQLLTVYLKIVKKKAHDMTILEKEFYHFWGDLYYEYLSIKEQSNESAIIQRHCEYVRECIVFGKPIEKYLIPVDKKIPVIKLENSINFIKQI